MSNNEVMQLLHMLSDAINYCDRNNLDYGDQLMELIIEIKETYNIDD